MASPSLALPISPPITLFDRLFPARDNHDVFADSEVKKGPITLLDKRVVQVALVVLALVALAFTLYFFGPALLVLASKAWTFLQASPTISYFLKIIPFIFSAILGGMIGEAVRASWRQGNPSSFAHYNAGVEAFDRGNYSMALCRLARAKDHAPNSSLTFALMGESMRRKGVKAKDVRLGPSHFYNEARKLDPTDLLANVGMCCLEISRGNIDCAEDYLKLSLEHNQRSDDRPYLYCDLLRACLDVDLRPTENNALTQLERIRHTKPPSKENTLQTWHIELCYVIVKFIQDLDWEPLQAFLDKEYLSDPQKEVINGIAYFWAGHDLESKNCFKKASTGVLPETVIKLVKYHLHEGTSLNSSNSETRKLTPPPFAKSIAMIHIAERDFLTEFLRVLLIRSTFIKRLYDESKQVTEQFIPGNGGLGSRSERGIQLGDSSGEVTDLETSLDKLTTCRHYFPASTKLLLQRAHIYQLMGDTPGALKCLHEAQKYDANNVEILDALIKNLQDLYDFNGDNLWMFERYEVIKKRLEIAVLDTNGQFRESIRNALKEHCLAMEQYGYYDMKTNKLLSPNKIVSGVN